MAGGPEDKALQDRGQRKLEEHPELRLAQSLPEGETLHNYEKRLEYFSYLNSYVLLFNFSHLFFIHDKTFKFVCLVPAGCQLSFWRSGEAGGLRLVTGSGCAL